MAKSPGYFQYYDAAGRVSKVKGTDIANFQYPVNWATMKAAGADYVHLKAGGNLRSLFSCRYIRNTVNGNSVNATPYFNEILAYSSGADNYATVANGASVTGSTVTPVVGAYADVIDGDSATYVVPAYSGSQYVIVDLGQLRSVYYIVMKHYYIDGRTFNFNTLEYSVDGIIWSLLYDSEQAGRYAEKSCGAGFWGNNGLNKDVQLTAANVAAARAAGIKVGFYWFNNPNYFNTVGQKWNNTVADAETNATKFYDNIVSELGSSDLGDILPMLDLENNFGSIYPAMDTDSAYDFCEAFINKFRELSGGRQVGLYTAYYTLEFFESPALVHSTKGGIADIMPLWLAATDTGVYPTWSFTTWGDYEANNGGYWTNWQYSSDGNGQGATWGVSTGDIDLDVLEVPIEWIEPPKKTLGVSATPGLNDVLVAWTLSVDSDVQLYNIYVDDILNTTVSKTQYSKLITGLTNGVSYKFEVAAVDLWEIGEKSDFVNATPVGASTTAVLAGKNAKISVYGSSIPFTTEATTSLSSTEYQITDTIKRIWDPFSAVSVFDGGVPTVEVYTLDRLSGRIIFATSGTRVITVSGDYLPLAVIGCAYEYNYTLSANNIDATCFENDFMLREQGLKSLEASLSKFYDINNYFINKWITDESFVIEFYSDGSVAPDIRAWAKISSDNPSAAVDGLVEEAIDFDSTIDADGNCVSFGPF